MYSLKNYFSSIHWKIQLWYGIFLIIILVGALLLAITSLQKKTFYEIDQELLNKVHIFGNAINAKLELNYIQKKHHEFKTGKEKHNKIHIITTWEIANKRKGQYIPLDEELDLKNYRSYQHKRLQLTKKEMSENGEYFIIYNPDRSILDQSDNIPLGIIVPGLKKPDIYFKKSWSRGFYRENLKYMLHGYVIVIGVNLKNSAKYQNYKQTIKNYIASAIAFYLVSFLGGVIIIKRALSPIREISFEVKEIALKNITNRLSIKNHTQEFLPLTTSLNETFESLEHTFQQQKAFTQNASHELKTPVTVILSQAEYSLENPRDIEHYINALNICQKNATQMKDLIEQLTSFTHIDSDNNDLTKQSIALNQLIEQCLLEIKPLAEKKNITLNTCLQPCQIKAPTKLARSIIDNLLSNAIHYNYEGGEVTVTCSHDTQGIHLIIEDNGIGIDEKDIDKIFDRFYRIDKSRSSLLGATGLGLAIVKDIVSTLDATLEVTSTVGQGSCFHVIFTY